MHLLETTLTTYTPKKQENKLPSSKTFVMFCFEPICLPVLNFCLANTHTFLSLLHTHVHNQTVQRFFLMWIVVKDKKRNWEAANGTGFYSMTSTLVMKELLLEACAAWTALA